MSSYFDALNRRRQEPPAVPATRSPARPSPVEPSGEEPSLVISPVEPPPPAQPPAFLQHSSPAAPPPRPRTLARTVLPEISYAAPRARPMASEPYEALRERLLVAGNGKALKTIVFAGCRGGEGCTPVVRELAQVLAASGLDVLVIDADRRAGELPAGQGVGPDLADLIQSGDSPAATECGGGRLAMVPRRTAITDKDQFYRAPEFAAWIAAQRERHDYVLLDAPPVLSFADATLMARVSDGAVVVARAEVTERETLVHASQQLERAGVKVIGVVLNGARDPVPAFLRPYLPTA